MDGPEAGYRKATPGSARAFARSARLHPGGVSHNIRYYEPYPFVTESASGARLRDVDGNEYVDYWTGHWSLILGHGHAAVAGALREQIDRGWMYGTVNAQTLELSEMIAAAVPAAEKIRYVTSGTEAVMYASRLARARTGRGTVAKADGGWHGYASDLLMGVNWPFTEPEGAGGGGEGAVSIPYNDLEGSLDVLGGHAGDLAAIVIEPVLGGGGCIPAEPDYLRGLEEFAHSSGALLVLDEIVTGFRFRYGCVYEEMGLDPDIVALGKIIGGGMAIGAICGRDEIMRLADAGSTPRGERAYVGGGTFSANPASMAAGRATLSELGSGGSVYSRIGSLGRLARDGLARAFDGRVAVTGRGSLFMTHFLRDGITEVASAADAARCDIAALQRYHFGMIARDGIFLLPGKLGAVSSAHTEGDVRDMIRASEEFSSGGP